MDGLSNFSIDCKHIKISINKDNVQFENFDEFYSTTFDLVPNYFDSFKVSDSIKILVNFKKLKVCKIWIFEKNFNF